MGKMTWGRFFLNRHFSGLTNYRDVLVWIRNRSKYSRLRRSSSARLLFSLFFVLQTYFLAAMTRIPLKICDPGSSTAHACNAIWADGTGIATSIVGVIENPWHCRFQRCAGSAQAPETRRLNRSISPSWIPHLECVLLFVYSEYIYRELNKETYGLYIIEAWHLKILTVRQCHMANTDTCLSA